MSDDALGALIAYRLEQADETLEEAQLMIDAAHFRAAVNRAYYAMFYAIQALLAKGGFSTSKHSGVISLFDREFVKTSRFDKEFSRWLHKLFELRQDADYGNMVKVSSEQARLAQEKAQAFVAQTKKLLAE